MRAGWKFKTVLNYCCWQAHENHKTAQLFAARTVKKWKMQR